MEAAEKGEVVETPPQQTPPPDVNDWSDPEPPRRDHRRSAITGY